MLRRLDPQTSEGLALASQTPDTVSLSGMLPPNVPGGGLVTRRINDPATGLPPKETYPTSAYHPSLSIDYIGSPGVGIGVAAHIVAGKSKTGDQHGAAENIRHISQHAAAIVGLQRLVIIRLELPMRSS